MSHTVTNRHHPLRTSIFRGALAATLVVALATLLVLPGCGDLARSNCIGVCEDRKQATCGTTIASDTDCGDFCQEQLDEADEIGCQGAYEDFLLQCETDSCGQADIGCDAAGKFLACYLQGCEEQPGAAACQ